MKIIASSKINSCFIDGIMFVLTKIGHDCIMWSCDKKPVFNMIDEQKPDVILISSKELIKFDLVKKEKPHTKIVYVGDIESNIPDLTLKEKPYANTVKYNIKDLNRKESISLERYIYDLIYISNYPLNIKEFNILRQIVNNFKIKFGIFGKHGYPIYEYLGNISRKENILLLNNCRAGVDFLGWNFLDFVLFNKPCFTFFDNPIFFPVQNINDMANIKEFYKINNPKEFIIDNKITDCHITSEMLEKLGYKKESEKCLSLLV